MPDERLHLVSLSVLGGSLHGRHFDPPDVVGEVLIGSDPDCHLVIDLPGISPIHARVWTELGQAKVHDTHAPRGVYVNTERVTTEAAAGDGDVIWLGPPNEPDSVCLQCRFEAWAEVLPSSGSTAADGAVAAEPLIEASETGPPPAAAPPAAALDGDVNDPFFVGSEEPVATAAPPTAASLAEPLAVDDWAVADDVPVVPAVIAPPATEGPDEFFISDQPATPVVEEPPPPPSPAPASDSRPAPPPQTPPAVTRPPAAPTARVPPTPTAAVARAAPTAPSAPPAVAATRQAPAPSAPATAPRAARPPVAGSPPAPGAARTPPTPARAMPSPPPKVPGAAAAALPARRRPDETIAAEGPVEPARRRPVAPAAARPAAMRPAASARRPPVAGRPVAQRASGGRSGSQRAVVIGVLGVALLAAAAFAVWRLMGPGVQLVSVDPARVRVGQRATLSGRGFAPLAGDNLVLFDDLPAKVLSASTVKLEIEVPAAVSEAGSERRVRVVVRRGSRSSDPVSIAVLQGPRLHALSTPAALPGQEVELAGAGWGIGAGVRFGAAEAQIVQADATHIRVIVPEGAGPIGTSAPVVVTVGGVESNPAPFVVGQLPVVTGVTPAAAGPGDLVELSGLGFDKQPQLNDLRVAGVPALVVSVSEGSLKFVVPRLGPGEPARSLELRVPGSANIGTTTLQVGPPADPVELRFVSEPFSAVPGRPHAVVATGLGPAFVLAAAGGRSAAERALSAQERLNQAIPLLRSTLGLNFEARAFESAPSVGLAGHPDALLEIAEEDAAAYNEDWSGLRGRGGAVTRGRLARWWDAVARDLVLLLLRGERPHFAAELAPEGKVLGQLFEAARQSGRPGLPLEVLDQARPPLRDGLRLIALRVPASVAAPAAPVAVAPGLAAAVSATPSPSAPPRLQLEGIFRGSETEAGEQRYLTVTFRKGEGSIAYEGGITLTMPLLSVEQRGRDEARFSVRIRGGMRYYAGKWDGERLSGAIATDGAGKNVVASFVLRR